MSKQWSLQRGEFKINSLRPSPLSTWVTLLFTLGLYEFWRRRTWFILTNRRVIIAKGVINRSVRVLPLDRVQDATIRNQLWEANIELSTAGGPGGVERLDVYLSPLPLRTWEARAFLDDLNDRISSARSDGLSGNPKPASAAAKPSSGASPRRSTIRPGGRVTGIAPCGRGSCCPGKRLASSMTAPRPDSTSTTSCFASCKRATTTAILPSDNPSTMTRTSRGSLGTTPARSR